MSKPLLLSPFFSKGAQVSELPGGGWRLDIPAGPKGRYRLAQLDDYTRLARRRFPWQAPLQMRLQARVSAAELPGTWGFGLWNDPFSLSLGLGGAGRRFPALPNAAWFFFASPPNFLSFRDDLPAQGFLAQGFAGQPLPVPLLAAASPAAALLALPFTAWLARRVLRWLTPQAAVQAAVDPTAWHEYQLDWQPEQVRFQVDGQILLEAPLRLHGLLGLVIWIDNQFAALPPGGRLSYGFLANPEPAWLELRGLQVQ